MKIGFLTQHGKEDCVGPVLRKHLGATVFRVDGFDTDSLGTFTREQPRQGTQLEAATRKAQIALERSDTDWGLGSEGAFHLDPYLSLLPWNTEMLVLLERGTGHRVVGLAHAKAMSVDLDASQWSALEAAAQRAGFPEHRLVLRRGGPDGVVVAKGVRDLKALRLAFDAAQGGDDSVRVHLENDLRAFANPTRQQVIVSAAQDLVTRFRSRCPACQAPGFGQHRVEPGAPCARCGNATRVARADIWRCPSCGHERTRPGPEPAVADPQRCDLSNP